MPRKFPGKTSSIYSIIISVKKNGVSEPRMSEKHLPWGCPTRQKLPGCRDSGKSPDETCRSETSRLWPGGPMVWRFTHHHCRLLIPIQKIGDIWRWMLLIIEVSERGFHVLFFKALLTTCRKRGLLGCHHRETHRGGQP